MLVKMAYKKRARGGWGRDRSIEAAQAELQAWLHRQDRSNRAPVAPAARSISVGWNAMHVTGPIRCGETASENA